MPVDGAGFYGTKNLGNRIAGDAMVKYVCGSREPDPLPEGIERDGFRVHDVTLVGEYNIAGELIINSETLRAMSRGARDPGNALGNGGTGTVNDR